MKKLICMGDSMVFGFGVKRSECWVSLLHETGGFAAVNRGVNGETTSDLVRRFENQILEARPDLLLIMAGSNDFFQGERITRAENNLIYLTRRAQAEGIRVLLSTITPYLPELVPPLLAESIRLPEALVQREALNERIRSRAECIDAASCIESLPRAEQAALYLDGVHLIAAGHRTVAGFLLPQICKAL